MPYNSAQISGLVGGQMAMFSNQAAYSQQVGGMAGIGPMPAGGGIQNPFPNAGTQVAGGIGMGIQGMATGASIGGMMMGGTMGWLDPMTGMARGFAGGAGMAGQGFGQVAGGIGNAFATGGLRAGAGMMAGGMAGAAAMALPYAIAGGVIQGVGENIYQGAQNIGDVGALSQHFGSQMGQPGSRQGGMGRQTIKNIVNVLHELVGDDVRTTMDDLKRVMDQAGSMGMLQGINNAAEFKSRFTKITRQIRDIADVMNTSMAEATPMFAQMRKMGLWTAQDVMGTAIAARVAGPAAGQMMQTMGQGAQMAHAMGGTMRAGAMMGRESFLSIQAAQRAGVLSQEDVMEFTGGVGGAEGQRMMAQRMTGIMGRFGQTSAGRLMMAGLGEREGGEYTGGINQGRMRQFLQGDVSIGQLQQMGQRGLTGEGAMSFERQSDRLGQQLGAQGGLEAMTQIVQQIADTKFKGSDQARHQLFRQMLGVSNREAEMLGKMADELPRIQDQRARETEAHTKRIFDELERKQYRSWEGFSNAAKGMMTQVTRPIQGVGEALATSIGQTTDRMTQMLTGRVEQIPMTVQERSRLMRGGALTADISQFAARDLDMKGDFLPNVIMRMQERGSAGRFAKGTLALGGGLVGLAIGGIAPLLGAGEDMTPQERALRNVGVTEGMTPSQARAMRMRAWKRVQDPTMAGLGLDDGEKLQSVKSRLKAVIGQHYSVLSDIKENDPARYTEKLVELMKEGNQDLSDMSEGEIRDYLAVAGQEYGEGPLSLELRRDASTGLGIATDAEGLAKQQVALVEKIASQTESTKNKVTRIGTAAVVMASVAAIPGIGTVTAGIMGLMGFGRGAGTGEKADVQQALTGEGSGIFMNFIKGRTSKEDALDILAKGGPGGGAVASIISKMSEGRRKALRPEVELFEAGRMAMIQPEERARIAAMVSGGPQTMGGFAGFGEAVEAYKKGEFGTAGRAVEGIAAGIQGPGELRKLRGGGAVGRQAAALYSVRQMGGELDKGQLKELQKQLSRSGYDLEGEGGDVVRDMMKEGISAGEMAGEEGKLGFRARVEKMVMSQLKGGGVQGATDRVRLEYIHANTKFVDAVNAALGGDALAKASAALNGTKSDSSAATPGLFGWGVGPF